MEMKQKQIGTNEIEIFEIRNMIKIKNLTK